MLPVSVLYWAVTLLLLPWRALRIRTGNLYGKLIGSMVFKLAGIRPVIENRQRIAEHRPAMYISNHTSTIDMWVGMWLCPMAGCGIAKKEIIKVPFFGLAYLLSGHLLVDRANRDRAIESMAAAANVVAKHKLSMWLWPEGTRSRDGRLRVFKKGFVHMAIATRLPIVPVVFHDANKRWPGKTFTVTPGDLRIEVLPVIRTEHWTEETVADHADEVWSAFQTALAPHQQTPPEDVLATLPSQEKET
jgi:1-acyl-sn-glycerol-3-phosphate acyltransferase